MIGYLEYLNMPTAIGVVIIALFLITQIIGEIIEFAGKTAPEFMKLRKFIKRKRAEREALKALPVKI